MSMIYDIRPIAYVGSNQTDYSPITLNELEAMDLKESVRYIPDLSEEDITILQEAVDAAVYQMYTEGANIEAIRNTRDYKKELNVEIKKIRRFLKQKDYEEARKSIDRAKKDSAEFRKKVHAEYSKMDKGLGKGDTLSKTICGQFMFCAQKTIAIWAIVAASVTGFAPLFVIAALTKTIKMVNHRVKALTRIMKKSFKDMEWSDLNSVMTECDNIFDGIDNYLQILDKETRALEKKHVDSKEKDVRESTDPIADSGINASSNSGTNDRAGFAKPIELVDTKDESAIDLAKLHPTPSSVGERVAVGHDGNDTVASMSSSSSGSNNSDFQKEVSNIQNAKVDVPIDKNQTKGIADAAMSAAGGIMGLGLAASGSSTAKESAYDLFYAIFENADEADEFVTFLNENAYLVDDDDELMLESKEHGNRAMVNETKKAFEELHSITKEISKLYNKKEYTKALKKVKEANQKMDSLRESVKKAYGMFTPGKLIKGFIYRFFKVCSYELIAAVASIYTLNIPSILVTLKELAEPIRTLKRWIGRFTGKGSDHDDFSFKDISGVYNSCMNVFDGFHDIFNSYEKKINEQIKTNGKEEDVKESACCDMSSPDAIAQIRKHAIEKNIECANQVLGKYDAPLHTPEDEIRYDAVREAFDLATCIYNMRRFTAEAKIMGIDLKELPAGKDAIKHMLVSTKNLNTAKAELSEAERKLLDKMIDELDHCYKSSVAKNKEQIKLETTELITEAALTSILDKIKKMIEKRKARREEIKARIKKIKEMKKKSEVRKGNVNLIKESSMFDDADWDGELEDTKDDVIKDDEILFKTAMDDIKADLSGAIARGNVKDIEKSLRELHKFAETLKMNYIVDFNIDEDGKADVGIEMYDRNIDLIEKLQKKVDQEAAKQNAVKTAAVKEFVEENHEFDDIFDENLYTEGVGEFVKNIKAKIDKRRLEKISINKKEMNKKINEARKQIKDKEFAEASKSIDAAVKCMGEYQKEVSAIYDEIKKADLKVDAKKKYYEMVRKSYPVDVYARLKKIASSLKKETDIKSELDTLKKVNREIHYLVDPEPEYTNTYSSNYTRNGGYGHSSGLNVTYHQKEMAPDDVVKAFKIGLDAMTKAFDKISITLTKMDSEKEDVKKESFDDIILNDDLYMEVAIELFDAEDIFEESLEKKLRQTAAEIGDAVSHPDGPIHKKVEEAANIDPAIKDDIATLNRKGYKTKYSSGGHPHLNKVSDTNKDGVYYGKLYSDARVQFDGHFKMPAAPKGWTWRDLDGDDYLDIIPKPYKDGDGSTDEAFKKWQNEYLTALHEWVDALPDVKNAKDASDEKENVEKESVSQFDLDTQLDMLLESVVSDIEYDLDVF